jgi:hypothetical protein
MLTEEVFAGLHDHRVTRISGRCRFVPEPTSGPPSVTGYASGVARKTMT